MENRVQIFLKMASSLELWPFWVQRGRQCLTPAEFLLYLWGRGCTDSHLGDMGLCGWICMNWNSLCRIRSPHILLQFLLPMPWQAPIPLFFGLWRKKKLLFNFWTTEYKMDLDCTRSLHTEARKRANRSRKSSPYGWASVSDMEGGLGSPSWSPHWFMFLAFINCVQLQLSSPEREKNIFEYLWHQWFPPRCFFFSLLRFHKRPRTGLEKGQQKQKCLRMT